MKQFRDNLLLQFSAASLVVMATDFDLIFSGPSLVSRKRPYTSQDCRG